MFVLLLLLLITILSWEKSETIRLEYKFSKEKCLNYSEIQLIERRDIEKRLDESIEYIQMNYTEQMIEIDSIEYIQRQINSVQIIPPNRYKHNQLFETTHRKVGDQSISRPVELSSVDGHILLPPPNEPNFPIDDISIGKSWSIPIMNSLGEVQYKVTKIDQNKIVTIEFEGGLKMSPDASLIGKWTFDNKRGITLTQQTISSSSILSDQQITKTITKRLLSKK
jgi:hypothetical protein